MQYVYDFPSEHYSSRLSQPIKWIIVHSTASPRDTRPIFTLQYLRQNDRKVSVHELVVPGFYVYRMVPDSLAAHHAEWDTVQYPDGDPKWSLSNESSWGIELYQVSGHPTMPGVVLTGLFRVAVACRRLRLTPDQVLGHREIDPTRRRDPVGVDMDWFRGQLREIMGWAPKEAG